MSTHAETLFVAHRGRVFRYLCRAVGQIETARDLTQDVFLRVTRSDPPSGSEDAQRGWLFSIARNIVIDHHRREGRRPIEASPDSVPARPASQDVATAVNQALTALPDLDRDVFLLREIAGLSYDEIAVACALSSDGVRSRIHRARLLLREQLAAPISQRRQHPIRRPGLSD